MSTFKAIGLGVVLFAVTDVDDLFVLLGLYASRYFQPRQIVIGQYLGFALLVLISIIASLVSLLFRPQYVGWLGLLPIAIGLRKLFCAGDDESDAAKTTSGSATGNILAVAGITVANGGDNIGVYTPVFATSSAAVIVCLCATFALMMAVWLLFTRWLANHAYLGKPIRRYSHVATPLLLILIGLHVLYAAGSISFH